jgi:hypothetical protein
MRLLFSYKKELVDTILFLNTAFSMIDKIFQQEITNAEIKKNYWVCFLLNNVCCMCCIGNACKHIFIPKEYVHPEECDGDILHKLLIGSRDSSNDIEHIFKNSHRVTNNEDDENNHSDNNI